MEALSLLFFSQKVLLGALFFLFFISKATGSGFQPDPTLLGLADRQIFSILFFCLFRFFFFSLVYFFSYSKKKIN